MGARLCRLSGSGLAVTTLWAVGPIEVPAAVGGREGRILVGGQVWAGYVLGSPPGGGGSVCEPAGARAGGAAAVRAEAVRCDPGSQPRAHGSSCCQVTRADAWEALGRCAHVMGKAEGSVAREEWHGHVTALSVAPEFRRLGLAAKLMELLEEISERKGGFFVDLFVRVSNQVAVNMYKQLGYSVYRTVIEYYSASNGEPDEDAYDMRKALSRDTEKKSIIPLPHPVRPEDIE
ncbi:N-alpha-acetyltransferase 20, NatB catalytic subunit [Tupaia chinensis]|uniref:N-alpha-acetyltransferase 20 n=1 Tax=Tupaia chinensis TaxID=246437 RepID=L8Y9B5_TUPCH|nr:N-alpha-acetyltransferase 20, NatB catalytic subunit [Tupaia chinensis]